MGANQWFSESAGKGPEGSPTVGTAAGSSEPTETPPPPPSRLSPDGPPPPPPAAPPPADSSTLPPNLTLADPSAVEPGSFLDEVGASQGMMGFARRDTGLMVGMKSLDGVAMPDGTIEGLPSLEIPIESFSSGPSESLTTVSLNEEVFAAPVRRDLVQRVVVWQRARRRQGTHRQKNISEVSGSGKKPWQQKGTGRARAGHRRPPHWRGGARAHPKRPRDYSFKLQKRVKNKALRAALSAKVLEGAIRVVDKTTLETHKTAPMAEWLAEREVDSALVIDAKASDDAEDSSRADASQLLSLSCGNIMNVDVISFEGANVYDIVRRKDLILTVDGLESLTSWVLNTGKSSLKKKSAVVDVDEQEEIRQLAQQQMMA